MSLYVTSFKLVTFQADILVAALTWFDSFSRER